MTTEFKAVTPQRAVEIMRAWAYHPWPITFDEGTRIYTSLGMRGDPEEPRFFYSDLAGAEADSSFIMRDYGISNCQVRLSNWLPEEYSESSRPRARAYYHDFAQAFRDVLGETRTSRERDDYAASLWIANGQVSVRLSGMPTLILLTVESPQQTEYTLEELEAEANGEEIGADYF